MQRRCKIPESRSRQGRGILYTYYSSHRGKSGRCAPSLRRSASDAALYGHTRVVVGKYIGAKTLLLYGKASRQERCSYPTRAKLLCYWIPELRSEIPPTLLILHGTNSRRVGGPSQSNGRKDVKQKLKTHRTLKRFRA